MFAQPQNKLKFKEIERRREFREEIKNRLKESNLKIPGFARLSHTGRIQCQICKTEHPEINSFRYHLREKTHRSALDSLKEELEVQRKVNSHIEQLIKAQNGEETMQEEAVDALLRDKSDSTLGKRSDAPQLVIEERFAPADDGTYSSAKHSVDSEDPDSNLKPPTTLKDEEEELARLGGSGEPDNLAGKEPSPSTPQPQEKDPQRNKEQTIENRLKARMEMMKERLKSKK